MLDEDAIKQLHRGRGQFQFAHPHKKHNFLKGLSRINKLTITTLQSGQ